MEYKELVKLYNNLESTTKNLKKRDFVSEFLKKAKTKELDILIPLILGNVYPKGKKDLGVASKTLKKVIIKSTGASKKEFEKVFKKTGDMGETAEKLVKAKTQQQLGKKKLKAKDVYKSLRKLPDIEGKGSESRKMSVLSGLISHATDKQAKYITRTALEKMRTGVGEGTVRDAIAKAFDKDKKKVEEVFNYIADYGKVARKAKKGELDKVSIEIGSPLKVMLARKSESLKEALGKFDNVAIETKYDGFRCAIHKDKDNITIFSRRLEDVTKQFPDLVELAKNGLSAKSCIVEGEVLAIHEDTERPMSFQKLSQRIQRKYDIEKMTEKIPIQMNLFDLVYYNGKNYMKKSLKERWKTLKKIVTESKNKFQLAQHIETKDKAKAKDFYKKALKAGQEGVIVKNLDAKYQPGKRVGYWLKVKPTMEPLDLVVVGAEWGEGKRAGWLSSYKLAARKGDDLIVVGKMASGFTEDQLDEMTKRLKKLVEDETGNTVKLKPKVVIEVNYEEIQKSPNYEGGYALRFPRLNRIRDDKSVADADTMKRIKRLYKQQRGRSS